MRKRALWGALLCLLAAIFLLIYPMYVIRPFRYQGQRELAAALFILQYRSIPEALLAIAALIFFGLTRRPAIGVLTAIIIGCSFLCRLNVYEKMFHPLEQPNFSSAGKSSLAGDEKVIAVRIQNAARAYPIRGMSYHHIVNDTLGGRAIVATY